MREGSSEFEGGSVLSMSLEIPSRDLGKVSVQTGVSTICPDHVSFKSSLETFKAHVSLVLFPGSGIEVVDFCCWIFSGQVLSVV